MASRARTQFAADIRAGLSRRPRQLPSRYLYDGLGSALFDAICHLPWYAVARAEQRLLTRVVDVDLLASHSTLVELGPGNGSKLAALMNRFSHDSRPVTVHLVDVSPAALRLAADTIRRARNVDVRLHEGSYEGGMDAFASSRDDRPALALLLGSNIGNFSPAESLALLAHMRARLRAGDSLLLGADLVNPESRLLLAYDDPLGVTAAFNRNLLVRLRTELDAVLDLDAFVHRAVWNAPETRVEMHLVATRAQRIVIEAADVDVAMAPGESIWTESSYKYEPDDLGTLLATSGFSVGSQWIDSEGRFALIYATAE